MNSTTYTTREEWLEAAIEQLRPLFADAGAEIPRVRVSVGWPGGRGNKNAVIGQYWAPSASADSVAQIFISPVLDDSLRVLDVLAHELVHAVDRNEHGHRGPFATLAKAVGLTGKMTATVASEELVVKLEGIVSEIGVYPHAALRDASQKAEGPKKQGTRMLKAECAHGSGYKVRLTRQWLEEYGAPLCACHREEMISE